MHEGRKLVRKPAQQGADTRKKLGAQSYNHKEMNSTNNLSEPESNSSLVGSLDEDMARMTHLDFCLVRPQVDAPVKLCQPSAHRNCELGIVLSCSL